MVLVPEAEAETRAMLDSQRRGKSIRTKNRSTQSEAERWRDMRVDGARTFHMIGSCSLDLVIVDRISWWTSLRVLDA